MLKTGIVVLVTVCVFVAVTWIVWTDGHKILAVLSVLWAIPVLLKFPQTGTQMVAWDAAATAVKRKRRVMGLLMMAGVGAVVWLLSWAGYILLRDIALVLGADALFVEGFKAVIA